MSLATRAVGARIREARLRLGWTAAEVADELSVHEMTVSKWERGVSHPSRRRLAALAALLGTTAVELAYGPAVKRKKRHAA